MVLCWSSIEIHCLFADAADADVDAAAADADTDVDAAACNDSEKPIFLIPFRG